MIKFTLKPDKTIECILYLAHKNIALDQHKLSTLFYLADHEHLTRYGRPITFDSYVAMEFGPVASFANNISEGLDGGSMPFEVKKIKGINFIVNPKRPVNFELFSKSDLRTFDEIVDKYGQFSFDDLCAITNENFAYNRALNSKDRPEFFRGIMFEDFFEGYAKKAEITNDLEFLAARI